MHKIGKIIFTEVSYTLDEWHLKQNKLNISLVLYKKYHGKPTTSCMKYEEVLLKTFYSDVAVSFRKVKFVIFLSSMIVLV